MATNAWRACRRRIIYTSLALLTTFPFLIALGEAASAQSSKDIARIITRVAEQVPDGAVVHIQPATESALNNRLSEEFKFALEHLGLTPIGNAQEGSFTLFFDAGVMGDVTAQDTSIGSVEGDAEGKLDFNLRLWSSGGGSSLFQGKNAPRNEVSLRGFRLNATMTIYDKQIWQGYAATNTKSGPPFETLAPLVQILIDRLDSNTDEIIQLR